MAGSEWARLEAVVRHGLRQLRERYLHSVRDWREQGVTDPTGASDEAGESSPELGDSLLCDLPVDMQLYIMTFLTPHDLCSLGMTNHYWDQMTRDRLLWRYFLLRDLPSWPSIEWHSLPDISILNSCLSESPDGATPDYMSVYVKSCPKNRKSTRARHPIYGAVTSFLQSLVMQTEPRFAMFGQGLEQLDDSLVTRMMTSPELRPVVSILQRQIDGIGSGVTFQLDDQHKFNILTLYSRTRNERDRARVDPNVVGNKMFVPEAPGDNQLATPDNLIPQVKEVCRIVDGFIYVANAESHNNHNRPEEMAQVLAMTDPTFGPLKRPLLVLSCIAQPGNKRIPCVYMAHELGLNKLQRPWMVQNTEASTLSGLLDGIAWILNEVGKKM
ncbi:F-box protein 4 L homeolog [Xenopus laevis]|uniref:F-box protein 4 L homeolog n=2 Tax=Xenopus laevis TaxID=8355 RepID=B1H1R3_XENLA|nr:F-box protein 4 L homeolog [Xenopus laevis]AAI60706.1 LOC100158284 protein [Xenopus laevis]OCU02565.1 hypothetical protein XELAEV_18008328mg [Xenopus laevis]